MKAWLALIQFSIFAICFILDPTPTIAEDTTDKKTERYLSDPVQTDNTNNNKIDKKQNLDTKHFCPKCKSHSLSFEGLNIYEGKQIQLINCRACGHEWQETWMLPNWLWLKSFSPTYHWTSERWNSE